MERFTLPEVALELSGSCGPVTLGYTTHGRLSPLKDNVIWICHALTANADPTEWWPEMVGHGKTFDPDEYFIICVNIPGSCYGSTGPLENKPGSQHPYFHDFPQLTNRDCVKMYDRLRAHLGIEKIHCLIGASLGGQQAMEWAIYAPDVFNKLILIATNAEHSAWGRAFNATQRHAIENDITWQLSYPGAGEQGLKIAREIALISYRRYEIYAVTQSEETSEYKSEYKAASYQRYQGEKLAARFNAFSYHMLSHMMDMHNVGAGRKSKESALQSIKARTLVIGITSDVLFPVTEQEFLAAHIPQASLEIIDSIYGHDGFLTEAEKLNHVITRFLPLNTLQQ